MQPGPRGYRAPAEDEVGSDDDMRFGIDGVEDDIEEDVDDENRQ